MRVDGPATGGQETFYRLQPSRSGRLCKQANFQIKVIASSSSQAKVGLRLEHGPDGTVSVLHSVPIPTTQLTGGNALLLNGDSDASKMLGNFLHPVITCISNDASPCWAVIEVYQLLKPF